MTHTPHTPDQIIAVTGATGFTGGALARRLLADGLQVRALVRNPDRARDLEAMGAKLCQGDIRDPEAVEHFLEGVDIVYHIAANFRDELSREEMFAINYGGTKVMLEAAEKAGVKRFVHCSTGGVHGDVPHPMANEEAPFNPGDYYQESKLEGEKLAWEYIKAGRLPISIVRPAGIYGAGDKRFLKLAKGIKTRRFFMIGDGKTLFHMVYIDDLVDGIILCGTVDEALGEAFLIAHDHHATLNELVDMIAEMVDSSVPSFKVPFYPVYLVGWGMEIIFKPLGINPPLYRRRVDFFRKNRSWDITKARTILGYEPKYTLREGVAKQIQYYKDEGLL